MVKPPALLPIVALTVRLVVLVIPLPVIAATSSPIASCPASDVEAAIKKLAVEGEEQDKAIAALSQCSNAAGALIWELENSASVQVRSAASEVLGQIATPDVIKSLASDLFGPPDAMVRLYAAKTLGEIGWEAKSTVPDLIAVSQQDSDPAVRKNAVLALAAIVRDSEGYFNQLQGWQVGEIQDLQSLRKQLQEEVLNGLKPDKGQEGTTAEDLASLQRATNALQTQLRGLTDRPSYRVVAWAQTYPWMVGGGLLLVIIGGIYGSIFLWKPLWLLKCSILIEATEKIPYMGTWLGLLLKLLSPLKYHPRVLDAWVEQHIGNVRKNLLQRPTIQRHEIHIPQPVFLGNSPSPVEFKPETFVGTFKGRFRLLIWGEGGAGKTSLTLQLAHWAMWGRAGEKEPYQDDKGLVTKLCRHRMIPILIEEALGDRSLEDAISAQLKELTEAEEISNELLRKLLQKQRVLVIVDHLSEITDESTHQKVRPSQDKDYPVSALIVTSRDRAIWGIEAVTVVQPSRITTENLAEFLNRYLPEKQKREGVTLTFNPDDYADAYKDLGNMISLRQVAETDRQQQPGTTILLVTLYANQMIVEKQKREKLDEYYFTTQPNLANNVPDLMLNYVDTLKNNTNNEGASQTFPGGPTQPEEQTIKLHKIAQLVAWKCLEKNYKPEAASLDDIEGREGVITALTNLESEAETSKKQAEQDLEYLKNLSLIQFQSNDRTLRLSLDPLAEYLAALYKFWEYRADQAAWIQFLEQIEITVDPYEVRGFLLALYDCCDKKGQGNPIQIPENVLKKLVELTKLDQAKIDTYYHKRRMRLALEYLKKDNPTDQLRAIEYLADQLRAIENLAKIAKEDQTLNQSAIRCLTEVLEDEGRLGQARREAGKALRKLGEPIPLLVPEIWGGVEYLHLMEPPEALIVELGDNVKLELVKIPAGEFWMGSEDKEGEGNERPRHKVQVAGFWMGRYLVTQAQWRVVANLDQINTELNPEPSFFKGDDHPVEAFPWWQTIEFCARLSRLTKQTYRLPSEAEWEYACRAGTEAPYHFGETITQDLANFSGRNAPNQTTPVGWYGVANRFGLYDMHGNVWEWCADRSHEDYEGAPIDGSAWVIDGDDGYRLLRGGSWSDRPDDCRSAYRSSYTRVDRNNALGFRVVCGLA